MMNKLLCQLCGTNAATKAAVEIKKTQNVFPSNNPNAANWKLYQKVLAESGPQKALESLPARVQEWWSLYQSGMRKTDIAAKTQAGKSSINDAIRRIENDGEDPYGK